MKFLISTFAFAAAGLHLASASDPRDQSGDVWKSLSSSSSLSKRQTTWNPPSNLVKPLQEVWDHEKATYNNGNLLGFKNYGYDILMASNGYVIILLTYLVLPPPLCSWIRFAMRLDEMKGE